MAQTSKRILIAGLGRHVAASHEVGPKLGIQKTNREIVLDVRPTREPLHPKRRSHAHQSNKQEIDKAKAAGYECSNMDVNPEQPEESIDQIKKLLMDKPQDLFIIGFGLRGNAVRQHLRQNSCCWSMEQYTDDDASL